MANKFTRYLGQFGSGLLSGATNPKGVFGDWKHATRIFIDDTFRLSPRTKFLYYVQFEIDNTAHSSSIFTNRHGQEAGLLVKTVELPKYTFDVETLNQYNRKKLVYKKIDYNAVNIAMHDDNAGVTNALWGLYYGYYIADRNLPNAAYETNHYRPTNTDKDKFRYGLDNNVGPSFLKSISIYTMSRQRFLGYTLVNPRIASWNHSDLSYAEDDTAESTMSIEYEAVKYSAGSVAYNNPKGFADLHYDTTPSPLSVQGGGTATLLGQGGVVDGVVGLLGGGRSGATGLEAIFGDPASGNALDEGPNFLGTAISAINTYKNLQNLSAEGVRDELVGAATGLAVLGGVAAVAGASSIAGSVFSRSSNTEAPTTAAPKSVTGGFAVDPQTGLPPVT